MKKVNKKKNSVCKLCLQARPLIKAHIIPRSFYPKDDNITVLTNNKNKYPKRAYKGLYDVNILCTECEKKFSVCDTEGTETLKNKKAKPHAFLGKYEYDEHGNDLFYEISSFNYHNLKMFFVTLLWRSIVSILPEFSSCNSSSDEEKLRNIINNDKPIPDYEYAVFCVRYIQGDYGFVLAPEAINIFGVNAIKFEFGGYKMFIKVDKRPFPDLVMKCILSPKRPFIAYTQDINDTAIPEAAMAMAKLHNWMPPQMRTPKK